MSNLGAILEQSLRRAKSLIHKTSVYLDNYFNYGMLSDNLNTQKYWDQKYTQIGDTWRYEHYEILIPLFPQNEAFSLLEIGCGTGEGIIFLKSVLPRAICSACDFSRVAIAAAREKTNEVEFYLCDAIKDEITAVYDYVLLVEILEHLDNPFSLIDKCLNHVRRCVIVMVPLNPMGYTGPVKGDFKSYEHRYAFSKDTFRGKYEYELHAKSGDYIVFSIKRKR